MLTQTLILHMKLINAKIVENYIYMEETKECINTCDGYLYINENENICYKSCISNKNAIFSTEDKKVCSDKCLKNGEKNFLNDKICING